MRSLIRKILFEELNQEPSDDLYSKGKEYLQSNFNEVRTLKQFKEKNLDLYNELIDGGLLRQLAQEFYFDDAMGSDKRKIYVYWWNEPYKVAYVGLTCNVEGRHKKHTRFCSSDFERNTAVGRHILNRIKNEIYPIMPYYDIIVSKYLTDEEAADLEKEAYDFYNTEYKMLNKAHAIGNLGSTKELSKYDGPAVWKELDAKKIGKFEDLVSIDPDLADYVKSRGPEVFGLRGEKVRNVYSMDFIKQKALEVGKEKLFKQQYPHLYTKLKNSKVLDREDIFNPEYKIEGRKKIYKNIDDLMSQLDPTIKKTVLQNRLVNKGSTQVRDKIGNYVTVTYPNFMEERYRRRLEKMIMEMIEKSITL